MEANRALRKEIDGLRVERQRFDNLYKKLEKEKEDLQQELNEVIDQSTQAYDQRWILWSFVFIIMYFEQTDALKLIKWNHMPDEAYGSDFTCWGPFDNYGADLSG